MSTSSRYLHIPEHQARIYTRWVRLDTYRADDPSRWHDDLMLRVTRRRRTGLFPISRHNFSLRIAGPLFEFRIAPIPRDEWDCDRPQHIFGWKFDVNPQVESKEQGR